MKEHLLSYYKENGELIKSVHIPERTDHKQRREAAKENGIDDWHHYVMPYDNWGMKNEDIDGKIGVCWYKIVDGVLMGPISNYDPFNT